jgi:2-keto-4-pentenoate hydratase/2-oxohepta-3-ene-1,7-dioic acid hydratase in catechol pathway
MLCAAVQRRSETGNAMQDYEVELAIIIQTGGDDGW